MSRRRLLRLLFSDSHILRRGRGTPPLSLATTITPSTPPSRRCFCSQEADGDARSKEDDPFTSFKCYTRRDPETPPYYVMEPPSFLSPTPRWPGERIALTEELLAQWNVHLLTCKSRLPEAPTTSHNVYLLGVGPDEISSDEIKRIMGCLKPEVLFLDLCANRRLLLATEKVTGNKWIQVHHHTCRIAFEEAIYNGAKVVLGDRPFPITVRRALEGMLEMRTWEFVKVSFFLFFHLMGYSKDNKGFNLYDFARQKLRALLAFPTILQPVIHERDQYMSSVLTKVAEENNSSVVAVVGKDHVPGIKNNWEQMDPQVKEHVSETSY